MDIANLLEILRLEKKKGRELIVISLCGVFRFLSVVILTQILKNLAVKGDIYDNPTDDALKIYKNSIRLIGGVRMLVASPVALGVMSVSVIQAVRRRLKYTC